jgi:hypothetical protein
MLSIACCVVYCARCTRALAASSIGNAPPGGEYHFQDVPHYHPFGAMRIEAALQDRAVERTQPTWKFSDRVRIHSAPARRKRQLCGAERVALRFGVNDL